MLAWVLSCSCRAATPAEGQLGVGRGRSQSLPWWPAILSERFSLPQLTLPDARVIALLLIEGNFDTFLFL